MHFSNHVDIANGPPLPPPNNVGMKKTRLGQGKVYSPAQTTTLLGGWGKRGGITADHISCPKSFVPHCSMKDMLYEVRCLISNEDMILALAGQFKQLSHEPEKFR